MELFVAWFFCALVAAHLAVSDRHRTHRILDADQAARGLQAIADESARDFWERERLRAETAAIEADNARILSKFVVRSTHATRPSPDESLDNARMKLWLHLRKNRF